MLSSIIYIVGWLDLIVLVALVSLNALQNVVT